MNKIKRANLGVHTISLAEKEDKLFDNEELEEIRQLCLYNAKVCEDQNEGQKENVWTLLADIVQSQMNNDDKTFNGWGGKGGGALGVDMVSYLFEYYEKIGDVQMLATMFCVLSGGHHGSKTKNCTFFLPKGRAAVYDTYIIRYGELLYSWGLLNTRAELNKHLKFPPYRNEFEFVSGEEGRPGLGVTCSCPNCNSEIESSTTSFCQHCKDFAFRCSICDNAVRGLFTFCEICKHGGHLNHIVDWFSNKTLCPTGCGCLCTFSTQLSQPMAEIGASELATDI